MQRMLWCLWACLVACVGLVADGIEGFWKSVDEETGKPQCVIAIYRYENKCYGRMIATFDKEGKMDGSIMTTSKSAPGVRGNPPYCGLDFIWNMVNKGMQYDGKIMDPRKGKVYEASMWRSKNDLIIRGKLLFFGKNTTWLPALDSELPPGFKKGDVAAFVPKIPKPN